MMACTRMEVEVPDVIRMPPGSLLASRNTGPETGKVRSNVAGSEAAARPAHKRKTADGQSIDLIKFLPADNNLHGLGRQAAVSLPENRRLTGLPSASH